MPGQLDEISEAIGGLRANTAGLKDTFEKHCDDDDRRHQENIGAIRDLRAEIGKLTEALAPIAEWVKGAKPDLEAVKISRWKTAGAIALAGALLAGIGLLIEATIGQFVRWFLPHH